MANRQSVQLVPVGEAQGSFPQAEVPMMGVAVVSLEPPWLLHIEQWRNLLLLGDVVLSLCY